MIRIKQATNKGYIECVRGGCADLSYPTSKTRRGRVQEHGNICPTLTTESEVYRMDVAHKGYAIRRLTPEECWRLMDFNDGAFDKAKEVNSSTQLYKQAGNSIVTNCLVAIIGQLLEGHEEDYKRVQE